MFDTSPSNLVRELDAGTKVRDSHLTKYGDMRRRYHGAHYQAQDSTTENFKENHYYSWVSMVVPKLVYDNPRVKVTSRRPGSQGEIAMAIQGGLNRWVRDVDLRKVLSEGPAVDMQFNYGVVMVRNEPIRGAKETENVGGTGKKGIPWAPHVYRIAQDRYVQDPMATTQEEIRWRGHMVVRDKEDILREAAEDPESGWNVDAVESLDMDKLDDLGRPDHITLDRGEVLLYEIYVPEVQLEGESGPEDGFHGAIYTVSPYSDGKYLREPRMYYGHPDGPYIMFGVYTVPGSPWPLSPLVAVEEQISELNLHTASASRSANDYKKLIFVEDSAPKLQQQIQSAEHHWVIPLPGMDRQKVLEVELAGITPQQIQYLQIARERLDRNSGISDVQRGVTGTSNSATEVSVANSAAQTRLGFVSQQFSYYTSVLLERVAWYLYHDNSVAYPLGADVAQQMGMEPTLHEDEGGNIRVIPPEPMFFGGDYDKDSTYTFHDLEIEIEMYSMARTNEGLVQRQTMDGVNLLMQIAQMAPQAPHINWPGVLKMISDTLNLPGMQRLYNPEIAAQVMMQMMGQAGEGASPTQPDLVPRGNEYRMRPTARRDPSQGADAKASPQEGAVSGPNAARGNVA